MILEQSKGVLCVDLDESFQTHICLQNLASIQPRTSPVKFAGSRHVTGVGGPATERPISKVMPYLRLALAAGVKPLKLRVCRAQNEKYK